MVGGILGARFVYVTTYWKRGICRPAALGNFHDPARRTGLLRRPHRRGDRRHHLSSAGKNCRCGKSPTCSRRASRWAAFLAASAACSTAAATAAPCDLPWAITFPPDNPLNPPTCAGASDGNLRRAAEPRLSTFFSRGCSGAKNSTARFLRPICICYAVTRSIVEYFRGDYPTDHIHFGLTPGATGQRPDFRRRPRAGGDSLAPR